MEFFKFLNELLRRFGKQKKNKKMFFVCFVELRSSKSYVAYYKYIDYTLEMITIGSIPEFQQKICERLS